MAIKTIKEQHQTISAEHLEKLGYNLQDLFNPSLAIHANCELNFSHIKLMGFDMDYTLAVYKKRPMELWQYDLARQYLINNMGYPEALCGFNYDPDLVIRGLVVDKDLGNI